MKNILKNQHVYGLVSPFSNSYNIRKPYPLHLNTRLKQSYKTLVKKDLMRITFFIS